MYTNVIIQYEKLENYFYNKSKLTYFETSWYNDNYIIIFYQCLCIIILRTSVECSNRRKTSLRNCRIDDVN